MAKTAEERDHVDRFIAELGPEVPSLDLEVEGIVERIGGLNRRFHRSMDETLAEFALTNVEW